MKKLEILQTIHPQQSLLLKIDKLLIGLIKLSVLLAHLIDFPKFNEATNSFYHII